MNLSLRFYYFRCWSSSASNEYFYRRHRWPHQFLSTRSGFLHPPLHAELTRTLDPISPEVKAWGFDSTGRRSPVSSRLCLLGGWLVGKFSLLCVLNLEIIVFYLRCLCCRWMGTPFNFVLSNPLHTDMLPQHLVCKYQLNCE